MGETRSGQYSCIRERAGMRRRREINRTARRSKMVKERFAHGDIDKDEFEDRRALGD